MQITEEELIKIINEEVQEMIENGDIDEGVLDRVKASAAGLGSGLKSKVAGAFGQDTTDIDTTRKLKQAASLMKSYDQQLLKLAQSLQADAAKLGIEDQTTKAQQAINQTRRQVASIARDAPTTARMQRKDRERYGDAGYSSQGQQQRQQAAPAQQQQQAAPAQQQQQGGGQGTPAQQSFYQSIKKGMDDIDARHADVAARRNKPLTRQQQKDLDAQGRRDADLLNQTRNAKTRAGAATAVKNYKKNTAKAKAKAQAKRKRELSQDPRNVKRRERYAKKRAAQKAAAKVPAAAASSAVNENETKNGETLNEQLQEISKRWGFDK